MVRSGEGYTRLERERCWCFLRFRCGCSEESKRLIIFLFDLFLINAIVSVFGPKQHGLDLSVTSSKAFLVILSMFFFLLKVVEDGYEFFADRRLVTVFSAPDYCGEFDNAGALMLVDQNLLCSFMVLCICFSPVLR